MQDSVFTKIIKGELPCHTVYEDDQTMAIMDIFPIQTGMMVVFPKTQIANVEDLPDDVAAALMKTVHRVMKAQRKVFPERKKITVQISGFQTPDHAHVVVFPADSGDEFLSHSPDEQAAATELAKLAEKLQAVI